MAQEKLSQKVSNGEVTTDITGYLHEIIPSGNTYVSRAIKPNNLVKNVITTIVEGTGTYTYSAQKGYLESISFKVNTGTPTVSVGTTSNGTELMQATLIADYDIAYLNKYFSTSASVYITVSGGTIDILIKKVNE